MYSDIAVTILAFLAGISHAICLEWFEGYPTMMTGNTIATSIAISERRWVDALYRSSLICGYMFGVAGGRCAELASKMRRGLESGDKEYLGIIAPIVAVIFAVADMWGRHRFHKADEGATADATVVSFSLRPSVLASASSLPSERQLLRSWGSSRRLCGGGLPELVSDVVPPLQLFDEYLVPLEGKKWHVTLLAVGYGMIYSSANRALDSTATHILTGHWTKVGETISDGFFTVEDGWWNEGVGTTARIIVSVVGGVMVGMRLLHAIDERFPFFMFIGVTYAAVLVAI